MYVDSNNRCRYCIHDINSSNKKEIVNQVKSFLISSGLYDLWWCGQKALYFKTYTVETNPYEKYLDIDLSLTDLELKCCKQLFNSRRQRVLRLKKRLFDIINNYDCLFLTLTFRDKVLSSTCEKTRRRYITRWLKSLCVPFAVANIDFGDKEKNPNSKEREHYHAIVQSKNIDLSSYSYGIINAERIRNCNSSTVKISKYINKLSYHAYKNSTGQCRLIYIKPQMKCLQLSF